MKKFEKWLKKFLVVLIRLLVPGPNRKDDSNDWPNYKRILVFRLDNRLGNSILILSLVQTIKKSLPHVCLDVLMTSSYVELYQNHPDIQNIIPYDQKYLFRNPFRFLSLINHLRKNKYDAVFSIESEDEVFPVIKMSSISKKDIKNKNRLLADELYRLDGKSSKRAAEEIEMMI